MVRVNKDIFYNINIYMKVIPKLEERFKPEDGIIFFTLIYIPSKNMIPSSDSEKNLKMMIVNYIYRENSRSKGYIILYNERMT